MAAVKNKYYYFLLKLVAKYMGLRLLIPAKIKAA
jgi:hypothetical protein